MPANLKADCPPVPELPSPLIDPLRAEWEAALIALYGDCGSKHRRTVEAWPR